MLKSRQEIDIKQLSSSFILTLTVPSPGRGEKNYLNFYFQTFLWCLKSFHEGLKSLYLKPFGTPQRSVKIKTEVIFYLHTTF